MFCEPYCEDVARAGGRREVGTERLPSGSRTAATPRRDPEKPFTLNWRNFEQSLGRGSGVLRTGRLLFIGMWGILEVDIPTLYPGSACVRGRVPFKERFLDSKRERGPLRSHFEKSLLLGFIPPSIRNRPVLR